MRAPWHRDHVGPPDQRTAEVLAQIRLVSLSMDAAADQLDQLVTQADGRLTDRRRSSPSVDVVRHNRDGDESGSSRGGHNA